jgi:DNA-binding NarL/FixJ family response regulator
MRRLRILVADDHPQVREALQKLLDRDFEVIGCVGDGRALVETAVELKPDLVVLDVGLPLMNGLEAGRALKKLMPEVKLIYLTMNADPDIAREAFRIGASDYLRKSSMGQELVQAIQRATDTNSRATPLPSGEGRIV